LLRDYPDWEAWRHRARSLKEEALDAWEGNLTRLERAVTAWGGHVLHARDASQARALILEVARRHRVSAVVKSKSMTTEEIGLNPALASAGLTVTETDLGEFIVQLAGHPPAHITAPAMHLNRRDVAQLFSQHLGISPPAEPAALSAAAGRYLAPRFEAAQMGITGVNFAALDGTLVFVENEGNLRRTACTPPVQVAVMGLEKLIPRVADLELFLRLLPASATGQRLTALVHLLKGLKSGPWGRQAFYLLLLDNGRRQLGREPELREALFCLRCGACLNICPVFQAGGAHLYGRVYPGAVGLVLAPFLPPPGDLADLCTQCGACGEICPAAIPLPRLILRLRAASRRFRLLRGLAGAAGHLLCQPHRYRWGERLWRQTAGRLWGMRARGVLGSPLAPASYHSLAATQDASTRERSARTPRLLPRAMATGPGPTEPPPKADGLAPNRFAEAQSSCHHLADAPALAAFIAAGAQGPVWLEAHPWLTALAPALEGLGLEVKVADHHWAPEAHTVVSLGVAAVPETGSVVLAPPAGPAGWLPFRACRQVVVVPAGRAALTLGQALSLTGPPEAPLITWLTGPTRTADIEKVLVLGAQGPAALEVVCYEADPPA
jgi:L-lactate dehydrogenase complex protein LldF